MSERRVVDVKNAAEIVKKYAGAISRDLSLCDVVECKYCEEGDE